MKTHLFSLCLMALPYFATAQTWYEIPTGTTKKLNAIDFPSDQVGYIGGNDSLLLKTVNGGETWTTLNYTGVNFLPGGGHILNLDFVSENVGYMTVGPYSGTYKTIDGGLNWTSLATSGNLCYNQGLFFFDEQNGFIGGSGCFQGELIDRMSSGTIAPANMYYSTWLSENRLVDIDFYSADYGLAASISGYIFRTVDGGISWDSIPSGLTDIPLTSVAIINDTLAYAGYNDLGSGFGILISTDSGLTWNMDMSSATFFYPAYFSVHQSGNGKVYSGAQPSWGNSGLIFESDAPGNWSYAEVDHPIYDLSSYNDSIVFAVGDSGYVVANIPPGNLSSHDFLSPDETSFGIYPNPTGDHFRIYSPPTNTITQIRILSLSGQVISEMPWNDEWIDVSEMPAGAYLIQLVLSERVETELLIRQ